MIQRISTGRAWLKPVKRSAVLVVVVGAVVGSNYLIQKPGLTPKALALVISYFAAVPITNYFAERRRAREERGKLRQDELDAQPISNNQVLESASREGTS